MVRVEVIRAGATVSETFVVPEGTSLGEFCTSDYLDCGGFTKVADTIRVNDDAEGRGYVLDEGDVISFYAKKQTSGAGK